jgi:hypothetical protein
MLPNSRANTVPTTVVMKMDELQETIPGILDAINWPTMTAQLYYQSFPNWAPADLWFSYEFVDEQRHAFIDVWSACETFSCLLSTLFFSFSKPLLFFRNSALAIVDKPTEQPRLVIAYEAILPVDEFDSAFGRRHQAAGSRCGGQGGRCIRHPSERECDGSDLNVAIRMRNLDLDPNHTSDGFLDGIASNQNQQGKYVVRVVVLVLNLRPWAGFIRHDSAVHV